MTQRLRSARRPLALLAAVLPAALLAPPALADDDSPPPPAATGATHYDFRDAHAFDGLGSNVWMNNENADGRDRVLDELAMRWVRVASGRPVVPPDRLDAAGHSVDAILGLFREFMAPTVPANADRLTGVMNRLGIGQQMVVWTMPAPWITIRTTDCPENATRCVFAEDDHLDEYANYVTAEVLFARELGLPADLVELGNEPDGYWNTLFTPEQYARQVTLTRAALDAQGLTDVGIQGPGTGSQRNAVPYLEELVATGAIDDLAALSVHDYDTSYTDRCDERLCIETPVGLSDEFQAALDRLGIDKTINITEYTNRDRAMWGSPCDDGTGTGRRNGVCELNDPEYALWLVTEGLKLFADGASSVLQWELTDQSWQPVNWGIVRRGGGVRPSYHAYRTMQDQMGDATSVVRGSTSDRDVVTAAFRVGAEVVVVVANLTDEAVTLRPVVRGLTRPPTRVVDQQVYSGDTGVSAPADVADGQAGLRVQVPPRSLVAITLS